MFMTFTDTNNQGLALYKSLLAECRQAFSDHHVAQRARQLIHWQFESNRHMQSHRLVTNALQAGYNVCSILLNVLDTKTDFETRL
jgi:hypothetical protein